MSAYDALRQIQEMKTMNRTRRILTVGAVVVTSWISAEHASFGATVPAGTTVVVTTVDALSSHEKPGRPFKAKLMTDLKAGGQTVVPAGTVIFGVVETSRNPMVKTTSSPLTVNLRNVSINGRRVAIQTTGALGPDTLSAVSPRQKITGVSVGKSILPRGTTLQFRLAQPLTI